MVDDDRAQGAGGLDRESGVGAPGEFRLDARGGDAGAEAVDEHGKAADAVRGVPHVDVAPLLGSLPPVDGPLDSDTAAAILGSFGIGAGGALPDSLAPLLAIIEATPPPLAERLLTELLARLVEPPASAG